MAPEGTSFFHINEPKMLADRRIAFIRSDYRRYASSSAAAISIC